MHAKLLKAMYNRTLHYIHTPLQNKITMEVPNGDEPQPVAPAVCVN